MKIRPLRDQVIVKREEASNRTSSGIIIPDTVKEKPQKGKVLAVSAGTRRDDGALLPLEVKKGDRILFGKYAGVEITIDGEECLMMKEEDIFGIIN